MNTSACFWLRLTGLSAFGLFSTLDPINATELKYWVSENYSASPKVDYELGGVLSNEYAPPVQLPIHSTVDQSEANALLCFDNRPLHKTGRVGNYFKEQDEFNGSVSFCEVNDLEEGTGFFSHPKRPTKSIITHGVSVGRTGGDKYYCDAIFTVHSLFSFLGQLEKIKADNSIEKVEITPYNPGQFLFADQETRLAFEEFLNDDDGFEISMTTGGEARFVRLEMNETWSCLAPAFKTYWQHVFQKCNQGIEYLVAHPEATQKHYDVFAEKWSDMAKAVNQCK